MVRSVIALCFLGLIVFFWAFSWWIRGPERSWQGKAFTPDGLRVLLVDFPGETNIVSYDPDKVSQTQLQNFSTAICGNSDTQLTQGNRSWIDKLRGHQRASFVCQ